MNNSTLRKKLLDLGYYNTDRILDLNVLYFDSYFYPLQRHLEYFYFQILLSNTNLEKLRNDRKYCINLLIKYPHLRDYTGKCFDVLLFLK